MSLCIRRLFSTTRIRRPFRVDSRGGYRLRPRGSPSFPREPRRRLELDPLEEERLELYAAISFLLRHNAGKDYGLPSRPDGYLATHKLLNYPMFRNLDIFQLQELVEEDRKYRFEIKYDPGIPEGPWWVYAKPWNEEHYILKTALLSSTHGTAVYTTTMREWDAYISRTGIARLDQEFIRLLPYAHNNNYLDKFNDENQVFIYLDIEACVRSGLRFYYQVHTSQIGDPAATPILTRGDRFGVIPPNLFQHVRSVDVKKRYLWGDEASFPIKPTPIDRTVTDATGRRRTFLPALRKNLPGFFDLYHMDGWKPRPSHPDTFKEAEEVVKVAA